MLGGYLSIYLSLSLEDLVIDMGWSVYDVSEPIAQKEHRCDASQLLHDWGLADSELTFTEYRTYIKAKRNSFKIVPGQKYVSCHGIYDGVPQTFRAIPEIDEICRRKGYYDDA